MINQALAFKLLSALTVVLLVAAAMPLLYGRAEKPAQAPSATGAVTGLQPGPAAAPKIAQAPPPKPATVVPAAPQAATAPVAVPPPPETAAAKTPPPAGDLASQWPNPNHAIASPAEPATPSAIANQPTGVRQSVYEADARAGMRPASPMPSSFDKPLTGDR
ncbi:MAG: hypothetical protein ABFC96_16490 [Thermoguttaceae bacterium]